jgi:hypothetical protein
LRCVDRRGFEIWTNSLGDEPGRRAAKIGAGIFNLSRVQRLICHIGNVTIRVVLRFEPPFTNPSVARWPACLDLWDCHVGNLGPLAHSDGRVKTESDRILETRCTEIRFRRGAQLARLSGTALPETG